MNQRTFFEKPPLEPVTNLIIKETEPISNEGAGITFTGYLPEDGHTPVGHVEGFIEDENYGDFDSIEVYPEWRERGFGTQLFKHFVNFAQAGEVKTIAISAANERTAHLMGAIPEVKEFTFIGDRGEPLDFTIEEAVKFLEEARIRQGLTEGDEKTEALKSVVRITAHMR